MRGHGRKIWLEAPGKYHFGRAALWRLGWERRTADDLERLIRREAEWNEAYGTTAVHGLEEKVDVALPGVEPPLRLRGNIDRVDIGRDFAQIVDYKSGRGISSEFRRARRAAAAAALCARLARAARRGAADRPLRLPQPSGEGVGAGQRQRG